MYGGVCGATTTTIFSTHLAPVSPGSYPSITIITRAITTTSTTITRAITTPSTTITTTVTILELIIVIRRVQVTDVEFKSLTF